MKTYRPILVIGITEIIIGGSVLLTNLITLALGSNQKSSNVLLFVITTGIISTILGIGILKFNKAAFQLLLYFSSIIIISKVLLLMNIIQLNGAFETIIPQSFKSCISIIYHSFVIFYLLQKDVRGVFLNIH